MQCDVLIVGGGINGCGIARDLAGRGLKVVLCEKDDLAQHTSSASTKLIHGGLRYLEYREFSLVRKALGEREVLLRSAPHIMWPLRFVMPHDRAMRPAWMIRAGLFLYDHLAKREILPGSRGVKLREHPAGVPLKPEFTKGFIYSDGWVDDARLVVLNAVDAVEHGATVLTRTKCVAAERGGDRWTVQLRIDASEPGAGSQATDTEPDDALEPSWRDTAGQVFRTEAAPETPGHGPTLHVLEARALVNAAGPWASSFLHREAHMKRAQSLRLVKGSHIVVRRWFEHDHAYIFQNADGRIIFAIPYEGDFTLIGTTDVEHHGPIGEAKISAEEIDYLCAQANHYFAKPLGPADVVWTYSGVRPLLDDESGNPAAVTRDYRLETSTDGAPLLNIWGGKITTFRKLSEDAGDAVCRLLGQSEPAWTGPAFLPGGDLQAFIGAPVRPDLDFERFVVAVQQQWPWLPAPLARRLCRAYGSRVEDLLDAATSLADLGEEVAPGLFEAELRFLQTTEWAVTADDVLWRRSKLGLHYTPAERERVAAWLAG
ncbi:MAG: glycerol-3-phosphate dehydrogenase [Rhizobacter sp.]|nr:glycerol-3-phosphate dehydrogenase [Rhizobacter sp.]